MEDYAKSFDEDNLAETWELSVHPAGPSVVASGEDAGMSLPDYIKAHGKQILGTNCERFDDFPILIKFIDANRDLSVQVHPDNAYAREYEGQYGKTEMWYVIEADEGAAICYGCSREFTKEEFRKHIEETTLDLAMNMVPVKKGDVFFIEAGTVHAIGGGILVAEIQQNSNVTYRLYDYGRVGADGKPRELHIEKGLAVANLKPPRTDYDFGDYLGICDCFAVDLIALESGSVKGEATEESFVSLLVTDGEGEIRDSFDLCPVKKGDSIFIPAGSGEYEIYGTLTVIRTVIPKVQEKES